MPTIVKAPIAFAALFALAIVYWIAIAMSWLLLPFVKLGFAFAAAPRYIRPLAKRVGDWLAGPAPRVKADIWCD